MSNHGDKDFNQWPQSEALRHFPYDRFFGLHWGRIKAEKWANFVQELTRTPGEYSRNGGAFWSPTNEEIASRLKVPVETVDDWSENGIHEPWEIAVVNAYARVGIVVTIDEPLVSPEAVQNAVDRAPTFEDVVETTGIPMPILLRHMVHGAPSHTHGRAYLLMDCEEYRQKTAAVMLHKENEDMNEQIPRLLGEGLTYEEIALELGVSTTVVGYRIGKLGLTPARAAKGGRQKVEARKRPAWDREDE